ncbi:aminoglycoside 6-adenylyltransferase [Paenibacillus sp. RC67]|uniref:aminoglycoside 6-adenylyltransferase n=1 Tax=Paenibacillus sp. RC67 TaxID=3039392 RepID=UPI0024AD45DB|nr:aminoglycoside 6-adenylyltransferase [Paenibacillus sp. RC67]
MTITRETIINEMVSNLEGEDFILAIWLEGSDGTQSLDEYSDIDLVCYTREGFVDNAISRLDDCLGRLGQLDIAYEQPGRPANNRYKVYHLLETSEHLLIDVTVQSESMPVAFIHEDQTVIPVVLVDKAGIVKYEHVEHASHGSELRRQWFRAQGIYSQRSRAVKYAQRGLFLESLIYYQKFVLQPLVDMLRIIHTPFQADCFLVHASRDFPADVVLALENLYGVKTVQDIAERIQVADDLFRRAAAEAEAKLSQLYGK